MISATVDALKVITSTVDEVLSRRINRLIVGNKVVQSCNKKWKLNLRWDSSPERCKDFSIQQLTSLRFYLLSKGDWYHSYISLRVRKCEGKREIFSHFKPYCTNVTIIWPSRRNPNRATPGEEEKLTNVCMRIPTAGTITFKDHIKNRIIYSYRWEKFKPVGSYL